MTKKSFLFIFTLTFSIVSLAQDPNFSQTLVGNVNINTALAGNDTVARLAVNYRNQWPGLSGNYITSSMNFYQYITKLNAYGGISYLNDNEANTFHTKKTSLFYSQNINFGKVLFRPSIELGFVTKRLDISNLTFGDQINPQLGFVSGTYETGYVLKEKVNYTILNAGAMIYYKNLLLGFSAHNINSPNTSMINGNSKLPINYGAQFSYQIEVNRLKLSISPFAFYNYQNGFQSTVVGINLLYNKHINFAFSTRSKDAFIFNLGYQNKYFALNYSYDITVSKLNNGTTQGSHEIGLAAKFWKVKSNKRFSTVKSVFN